MGYIAHKDQSLNDHLTGTARLCRSNAAKIGCADYGEILGLLHDLGKYSQEYQAYIKSAIGELNPDIDSDFVDFQALKGKIDHSTAGAQFVWGRLSGADGLTQLLGQMLAICLAGHHGGMLDIITHGDTGTFNAFFDRLSKDDTKTHLQETLAQAEVLDRVTQLLSNPDLVTPLKDIAESIRKRHPNLTAPSQLSHVAYFQLGILTRFLFSCLIDADRQDSADSENPVSANLRHVGNYQDWAILIERLEAKIASFGPPATPVNKIRAQVADDCLKAAGRNPGVFSLTVPTGGGKTLSSLRFALNHAEKHGLKRVFYIIPFTSIIDQNAQEVREIFEAGPGDRGQIVLEHHSNISPEIQTWREKVLSENWDAPIVFTTMVQFLEAFFGRGTRGARRMHQLAESVVIFDEVQALPSQCTHMFCNAVNFLVDQCRSTAVLCTATQPSFNFISEAYGNLIVPNGGEIIPNPKKLFEDLSRVTIRNLQRPEKWTESEVITLAEQGVLESGSCLIIVNTKRSARLLFQATQNRFPACYHLSTSMCPAHRKRILKEVKANLKAGVPTLCISTQLIEAGVDIDFGTVIRYLAGMDSIAQAAGRCNRHGTRAMGKVYIVNPQDEKLGPLDEIRAGQQISARLIQDFEDTPDTFDNNPLGPSMLTTYYKYFFHPVKRREKMAYALEDGAQGSLCDMLGWNSILTADFRRTHGKDSLKGVPLKQAFRTASKEFQVFDEGNQSVIVPYGKEGASLIQKLQGTADVQEQKHLMREAQQYAVNLFPKEFDRLLDQGLITQNPGQLRIFFLTDGFYDSNFGVVTNADPM